MFAGFNREDDPPMSIHTDTFSRNTWYKEWKTYLYVPKEYIQSVVKILRYLDIHRFQEVVITRDRIMGVYLQVDTDPHSSRLRDEMLTRSIPFSIYHEFIKEAHNHSFSYHNRYNEDGRAILRKIEEKEKYIDLVDLHRSVNGNDRLYKRIILDKVKYLQIMPWDNQEEYAARHKAKAFLADSMPAPIPDPDMIPF